VLLRGAWSKSTGRGRGKEDGRVYCLTRSPRRPLDGFLAAERKENVMAPDIASVLPAVRAGCSARGGA
jgi:hypothetical protein